jgi:hypothetical protein
MIAVSYIYYPDNVHQVNVFREEEDAKLWLIDELFQLGIMTSWTDIVDGEEPVDYTEEEDIRKCLLRTELVEIIEGANCVGDIDIKVAIM